MVTVRTVLAFCVLGRSLMTCGPNGDTLRWLMLAALSRCKQSFSSSALAEACSSWFSLPGRCW
jgi:hypothetical protein